MTRGGIMSTRARIVERLDAMAEEHDMHAIGMAARTWYDYTVYAPGHVGTKHSAERLKHLADARESTSRASCAAHNYGDELLSKEIAALGGMME